MNNLKTLSLLNHNPDTQRFMQTSFSELNLFSNQNYLFFRNITRLELNHFFKISAETLLGFISKMPKLKQLYFLDVDCFYRNNRMDISELQKSLSNISSVELELSDAQDNIQYSFLNDLVIALSNQLQHLTIHQNSNTFIGTNAMFGELVSCCLKDFNFDIANNI